MKILSTTAVAASAGLGFLMLASSTVGCSADEPGGSAAGSSSSASAKVVGVYEALNVQELAPEAIARFAIAEGQYLLFTAECVRSRAPDCEEQGKYTMASTGERIELVNDRDGGRRSLPFAVVSSGQKGDVGPKGICIVGSPRCPLEGTPPSGGTSGSTSGGGTSGTLIVGDQQPQLATPSQILIQCRGNCAVTIRMNGQVLQATGDDLNVTVPAPSSP